MDQNSLVNEQIDAGAELVLRFDKSRPVNAAFWLKLPDDFQWYLYLASDQIDDTNVDLGYGEIVRLVKEMQDPYLDPFQVKLIPTNHPLARAVLDVYKRYPAKIPTRYNQPTLGDRSIDGAYLYALPITLSSS